MDRLLADGVTVRALYRPQTPPSRRDPRVQAFEADLEDDRSVRISPVWEGASEVYHVAGVTKARTLGQFRAGNVFPTANVLAALAARVAQRRVSPRVVLVSSQAAAGPALSPEHPVRESDRPVPIENYGRSKLQSEQAVVRYADVLDVTIVRPGAVYGPRDMDFLAAFKQAQSRVALHAAPRDQQFSSVHVDDLVLALRLAARTPDAIGKTYFVSGETVTWRQLYARVAELAGSTPREVQVPALALRLAGRAGDAWSLLTGTAPLVNSNKTALARAAWWLCDPARATSELGWSPRLSFDEGIQQTFEWYRREGWLKSPSARPTTS